MIGTWDFKTDRIVQMTFCEALEKLTDSDLGWREMTEIYERERQRADHQHRGAGTYPGSLPAVCLRRLEKRPRTSAGLRRSSKEQHRPSRNNN